MADLFTHQVSHVVAILLRDLSFGVLRASNNPPNSWPISIGSEEDSPDNVITVYDTEAKPEGRAQPTGEQLSHPAVQVRVRAKTGRIAFAKAKDIAYAFDKTVYRQAVTVETSVYCIQSISRMAGLVYIGKRATESQRDLVMINAYVTLRQIS